MYDFMPVLSVSNYFFILFFLEQSLERQVLRDQCRRLEAQNYNLSLTAEQLSHSMGVRHTHTHVHDPSD